MPISNRKNIKLIYVYVVNSEDDQKITAKNNGVIIPKVISQIQKIFILAPIAFKSVLKRPNP